MQHYDIGHFDLSLDVDESFFKKRGEIQEQTEKLSICALQDDGLQEFVEIR